MDAKLVWDTWRRILTSDQLVDYVLHSRDSKALEHLDLRLREIPIVADYASTPAATQTNIGMYRRGLVRNVLAALSLVPLSRHLLYASGLDVEAVAANFVHSVGYVDDGPNLWRIAARFVAHLRNHEGFATRSWQDVLALDEDTAALARRLCESIANVAPENAVEAFSAETPRGTHSAHFLASRSAVVASSSYDLTAWVENPNELTPRRNLNYHAARG